MLSPPAAATTHSEDLQVRPQPWSGLSLSDDSEIQKPLCDALKALSSCRKVAVRLSLLEEPLPLRVIEQRHETEVHVQLLVAVEKGKAGVVGNEINL